MPELSGHRIMSNRRLNFTLSPVIKYNPKEMPYSLPDYQIDGTWNQHQSIILDILLDFIVKKRYAKYKNFPVTWKKNEVMKVNYESAGHLFSPSVITYLSKNPIEAYYVKSGYDLVKQAKDNFDGGYKAPDNKTSFEEYLNAYLAENYSYQKFIEEIKDILNYYSEDISIVIDPVNLFKNYSILSNYKYNLYKIIENISNTKFKMDYTVRCLAKEHQIDDNKNVVQEGKLVSVDYLMKDFQEIFIFKIIENNINLNFKSPLGKMILHNALIIDADWIEEEALTLKTNAYFIYKKFILNRVAGDNKTRTIVLWYEDIKKFLDLKWKNDSGNYKIIEKAFDQMQEKGLIEGHDWVRNYKQRQYRVIRTLEKKKKKSNKSLKVGT